MKKVQVLGGGCSKCITLADEVQKAAKEMSVEIDLEKVTDFQKIAAMGVMSTPALVVDGKVAFSGKVLKAEALKEYLL
ncbi:MAG TPA: thioredoxin family protein [Fibrobacteraceae bacterium]|nr:thioredoxin family protein [Fibrobacteraceae bacterium]